MKQVTLRDRLRYEFDNFMSRGTPALVAALLVATTLMVMAATVVLLVGRVRVDESTEAVGPVEVFWRVIMHAIDTGTVTASSGWSYRLVGFVVTLGGIFIVSALIGVLASGLEGMLSELRRGRSRVIETGHTRCPQLVAAGVHHRVRAGRCQPEPAQGAQHRRQGAARAW